MKSFLNNTSRYGVHYLLKGLAASLFYVFIPVYLYANGFSLVQVGIFYALQELFNFIFSYLLFRKTHHWGLRNILVAAALTQLALIFLTYKFLALDYVFVLSVSLLRGLHDSFYWGADEMIMVHLPAPGRKVGEFLGRWNFAITVLQAASMPVSAYILDRYSPFWLIAIAVFLLLVSILPLLKLKLEELPNNRSLRIGEMLKTAENRYFGTVNHLNEVMTKIPDTLLPLLIFTAFGNYLSVGVAGVFATLATAVYSYFVSSRSEEKNKRRKILGYNVAGYLLFLSLVIVFRSKLFIFVAVAGLTLLRLGACLSSTVGINQICRKGDCYAIKMFGRMASNLSGVFVGLAVILAGIVSFDTAFVSVAFYIFLISSIVYKFRRFI